MNNIVEQDHRFIKKRIAASLGFRSVEGALQTVAGYEAMHAISRSCGVHRMTRSTSTPAAITPGRRARNDALPPSQSLGSIGKWRGLVTYYVLFFLHLETRGITIAGITQHPDGAWMEQIARTATQESWGYLNRCRYVLHDRDKKFCPSFRSALAAAGVKPIMLPAKSPNLNAYAERWVRSVKTSACPNWFYLAKVHCSAAWPNSPLTIISNAITRAKTTSY